MAGIFDAEANGYYGRQASAVVGTVCRNARSGERLCGWWREWKRMLVTKAEIARAAILSTLHSLGGTDGGRIASLGEFSLGVGVEPISTTYRGTGTSTKILRTARAWLWRLEMAEHYGVLLLLRQTCPVSVGNWKCIRRRGQKLAYADLGRTTQEIRGSQKIPVRWKGMLSRNYATERAVNRPCESALRGRPWHFALQWTPYLSVVDPTRAPLFSLIQKQL